MRTINNVMAQLTDAKSLIENLKDTLRQTDPDYMAEEERHLCAAIALNQVIGNSIFPSASEYLAAKEQELVSGMIYAGWLGFQLNLNCFQNPVNKLVLNEDYEDICQERRMHTLPMAKKALDTIAAFSKALPADKQDLTDDIVSYYSYLQTYGYKLAHYFGFRLADAFLPYVILGYSGDYTISNQYKAELQEYLNINLDHIT